MSETPLERIHRRVREMARRNAEIIEKAEAEGRLRREIRHESMYGPFPGGDPRRFTPDPDASTEAERARHAAACDDATRGEGLERDPHCELMGDGSNARGQGFGCGVSLVDVEFLIVTNEDGTKTEFF